MTPQIDYEKELNPAQLEAVQSIEGPHLIIAGAGSGKTRVLVFRTAYLVEQGVAPHKILLLTFTRRASNEMLERASVLLDDRCQKVSGGTFHSFANRILRQYGEAIGLSSHFTIMDQSDAENAVNLVRAQLGLDKVDKRFPRKQMILSLISKSVNKDVNLESVIYDECPHLVQWADSIERIKDSYIQYKRSMSLLDYDDLLLYLCNLLGAHPQVRQKIAKKYEYIMVDEYQDTNKMQAEIVKLLTIEHQNIMVVGDDSQSIYSFRGANFKNIIDFPRTFPTAKVIMLEENYRSSQPILNLTNDVIHSAEEKFDKALFTKKKGNARPVYADVFNENRQSKYIVNKILDLRREGVPLDEIAVLFRSGWHSNDLEVELSSYGISFLKYGGQKFIEAAHIKDIMSYLRVAHNLNDEVSWLRMLMLMRGTGPRSAAQIVKQVVYERRGLNVDEQILKKKDNVKRLFGLLKQIDVKTETPEEILLKVMGFYYPLLMDKYDDYDKRINDLDSLQGIAARYKSVEQFLADMALDPPEKTIVDANADERDPDHLVLSTIHSAKGLEWHTVFVIFVAEGYLPSYRSLDSEEAIEEERRLFYVATTRAKENLILLRPQMDRSAKGQWDSTSSGYTRISRFLNEGQILRKFVKHESDYARGYSSSGGMRAASGYGYGQKFDAQEF